MRNRKMEVCVWAFSDTYPENGRGFKYVSLYYGENVFRGLFVATSARLNGVKKVRVTYK